MKAQERLQGSYVISGYKEENVDFFVINTFFSTKVEVFRFLTKEDKGFSNKLEKRNGGSNSLRQLIRNSQFASTPKTHP